MSYRVFTRCSRTVFTPERELLILEDPKCRRPVLSGAGVEWSGVAAVGTCVAVICVVDTSVVDTCVVVISANSARQ